MFDASVDIDATRLEPMITYGTNPGMVVPISGAIPAAAGDPVYDKALGYMGFHGGEAMLGKPVNVVFIGSCTNGRLEDLQAAAQILKGRKVASGVHLLIVPGSQQVKRDAEAAGLGEIFKAAGADWRESGCSMCLGMNGDTVPAGQYAISTSNRNFEGRQGVGARTLLVSPLTAAASAVQRKDRRSAGDVLMQPLKRVRSRTVVIPATNVDTDQIIPARFLTTTTKQGLGKHLFADWRYLPDGTPNPRFILNQDAARGCQVLVAGRNFGCGSSREHAPWALMDYGIRAVISTEIADIFRTNSLKNGLVPVTVDDATAAWLLEHPGAEVDIDLEAARLTLPTRSRRGFSDRGVCAPLPAQWAR